MIFLAVILAPIAVAAVLLRYIDTPRPAPLLHELPLEGPWACGCVFWDGGPVFEPCPLHRPRPLTKADCELMA